MAIDKRSETWLTIKEWANGRLSKNRDILEDPSTTEALTNSHRGAIGELKELLALADDKKPVVGETSGNYGMGVDHG